MKPESSSADLTTQGNFVGCQCQATANTCGPPQSCDLNGCEGQFNLDNGKAFCTKNFVGCECTATANTCGNPQSCDMDNCDGQFQGSVRNPVCTNFFNGCECVATSVSLIRPTWHVAKERLLTLCRRACCSRTHVEPHKTVDSTAVVDPLTSTTARPFARITSSGANALQMEQPAAPSKAAIKTIARGNSTAIRQRPRALTSSRVVLAPPLR